MDPQVQQSGIFVLAIFLAVVVERGWQWLLRRRARQWAMAPGRVYTADWRQPRTGTNRYFVGELSYSYIADGNFYSGYYRRSFSSRADASNWVRWWQGAEVRVRYRAASPERSLLLEDEQESRAELATEVEVENSELATAGD